MARGFETSPVHNNCQVGVLSSRLADWPEKSAFLATDMWQTVEKAVLGLHYGKHLKYIHITLIAKCLVDRCCDLCRVLVVSISVLRFSDTRQRDNCEEVSHNTNALQKTLGVGQKYIE